jgi:hypothetical protein
MKGNIKSEQDGFLKLIIFIVVALFLMKYFKISLADIVDWVKTLFNSVL